MLFKQLYCSENNLANVTYELCALLLLLPKKGINFPFKALVGPLSKIGLGVVRGGVLKRDA